MLARSRAIWGADRISGLRCQSCGTLFDAEDIAQVLLEKHSQLEQFGLVTPPATGTDPVPFAMPGVFRLKKV